MSHTKQRFFQMPGPAAALDRDAGAPLANRGLAMELFVEAAWLAEHLADPAVAVVDTRSMPLTMYYASFGREQYLMGHIPGAIHLDYVTDLRDPERPYAAFVAPPKRFADAMTNAGIGDDTTVIAYDGGDFPYAARLVWMLHYYGHQAAAILDGGIDAWMRAGLPRESEIPLRDVQDFTPRVHPERRATYEEVLDVVERRSDAQLLSVLGDAAYAMRDRDIPRARRLSCSLLFDEVEGGRLISSDRLASLTAGLEPGKRTIAYCSNGVSAAGAYVALRTVGFTNVAVYDGSLADWTHHNSPTVATR
jgi:thiosulfate/3-mercaptopyruvate sulfurtransferase